ncbi:MAG: hypothetical protein NT013_19105 [Planctomycetia bacterium]|nr:hypothetical protein [Planctomycetia bacterium]
MILAAKRVTLQTMISQFTKGHGWIWAVLVVVAVIVMFAIVIKLREWFRSQTQSESSPEQLLLEFRKAHQQGELSADEYKTIREQLFKKSGEVDQKDISGSGPSAGDSVGSPHPNSD